MKFHKMIISLSMCFSIYTSYLYSYDFQATYDLYTAAATNDLNLAIKAIESNADINAYSADGLNILHMAIIKKSYDVAKLLIKSGANLESRINYTYENASPIILAMRLKDNTLIETLIQAGATFYDIEFIHTGIYNHLNEIVIKFMTEAYLQIGTIDVVCSNGNTTVHTAAISDNDTMILWLIKNGADINICNEIGDSPLHCAALSQANNAIKILIEHGANVNIQNNLGETPLFKAVENNSYDTAALLLNLGADVNKKDNYNLDPLYEALSNQNDKMIELLIAHGAINID